MKTGIHPKYKKTTIKCVCGNEFDTRSTVFPVIQVELCSVCHPFYTGKQKFVDTAGRVDKFQARIKAAEEKKKTQNKKETSKPLIKDEKDNQKVLTDIKKGITKSEDPKDKLPPKPMTVTQEMSSDVETAAASELDEVKKEN